METMDEPTDDEGDVELVDEELTEVFRAADEMGCQAAIEEVLAPNDIPAMMHNRVSHAFPAPASLPGAYFVAVPVGTPVCFELTPKENTTLPALDTLQWFVAFVDVVGEPGGIALDHRDVLFLVPPK